MLRPSPRRPVPARRRLLGLGPAQLIAVELAALAVLLAPRTAVALAATAGAAALVTLLAVGRWRGRWLHERLALRLDLRRRHRTGWDRGGPTAVLDRWEIVDEPGRAGEPVAVLRDELGWSALLTAEPSTILTPPPTTPTDPAGEPGELAGTGGSDGASDTGTASGAGASGGGRAEVRAATGSDSATLWETLAGVLEREPVRPAAVQLVVHTRSGPAGPVRRWWLALRIDPVRSAAAIAERGGGRTGARRAVRAAALRLATDLSVRGLTARPLGAAEARAVLRLTAGPLAGGTETRSGWRHGGAWQRYHWVRRVPDGGALTALTAAPGTVSATLLPPPDRTAGPDAGRAPDPGGRDSGPAGDRAVDCRILVGADGVATGGLSLLDGEHGPALLASVPLAAPALRRRRPHRLPVGVLTALTREAPGADLLVGYGAGGQPVLARLHRAVPTTIALLGGAYAASLLVLRAVRAGARVTVVTTRPPAWQALVRPTIGPAAPPPIALVAPQAVPAGLGTPDQPTLLVLDAGSRQPPSAPWLTTVQLVGKATAATARALHTADLVLAHRLTRAEARLLCAEQQLPAEQAYWLAESPGDGIAAVVDGDLRHLRLSPTAAETGQLGPPTR
jgi:hypothetical protein